MAAHGTPGTWAAAIEIMLSLILSVAVAGAGATPAVNLQPVDPASVPDACKPAAKQLATPSLPLALEARLALARCMAEQALAKLELVDCGESVTAVDTATAPAFALLDEVAAAGNPALAVVAEHTRAELYGTMRMRMLATVPAEPAGQLHDARIAVLETLMQPWREQSDAAYKRAVAIAKAHPELAKNPVVQNVLRRVPRS
jgi:hypothetical protein